MRGYLNAKWDDIYTRKLQSRALLNIKCQTDLDFRQEVKSACKQSFEFFCDNFLYTYDPRRKPSKLPFILYSRQRKLTDWLENKYQNNQDGFVDKPRDVGATVTCMAWLFWHWLFDENFSARVGSRKEHYVDKIGDPGTLFAKLDYFLECIPDWLRPNMTVKNRKLLLLTNPETKSTITGESSNPNFARGDRQGVILMDELAFWEHNRSAWESAGDVTNTRICLTTPPETGRSSFVYKLRNQDKGKIDVFEFNYFDVPHKTEEWLLGEKERRSKEEFEREVLKSYSGISAVKVYASEWNRNVRKDPALTYNPTLPLFVSWDYGLDGTALIWLQKDWNTRTIYMIDAFQRVPATGLVIDFFLPFIGFPIESGKFEYVPDELRKIAEHASWSKDAYHFGDISGRHKSMVANQQNMPSSIEQVLASHGVYVQSKNNPGHLECREKTKQLFHRLVVNPNKCADAIDCIVSARYPNTLLTIRERTSSVQKPVHDDTSHMRTALEYFAINEPEKEIGTTKRFIRRIGV